MKIIVRKGFILDKIATNQPLALTNNEHCQGYFINFKDINFFEISLIWPF